jgi:hypothetical protein
MGGFFVGGAGAQVVTPPAPQLGSSNTVSADPAVTRPNTRHCTVQLLHNQEFADFNAKPMMYTPPANCPGPWSRVVLSVDFTVTAGRQFDRTAEFFLGNANIFYGTTAEPRAKLSPTWHVERDETDLSALFKTSQTGQAILGNFVGTSGGVDYTGLIYANVWLDFYETDPSNPAPAVADQVVPVPNMPGGAGTLNTGTDVVSTAVTLPRNTESVYLDVFAQSQSADEFWYACVPNDVATELQSCPNTAFRETEITIDGKPAGTAPVFPWIFTGGIDPYLWEPIPGAQTLNFKPFRVNLTPFAGLLADGSAHTVGIGVYNADSYFLATGNLLVFTDHNAQSVTGAVTSNTLAALPTPNVVEKLTNKSGTISGTVSVTSARDYQITGYVNTSHGRVETTVRQQGNFVNQQNFLVNNAQSRQDITQWTLVKVTTTTRDGNRPWLTMEKEYEYPLTLNLDLLFNKDGSISENNYALQKYIQNDWTHLGTGLVYSNTTANVVNAADTEKYTLVNGNYSLTSHSGQHSEQAYFFHDSVGRCYGRILTAKNSVLTGDRDGVGCSMK